MQKKVKTARPPSFISIVIKAIRPRQTWDDKVVSVMRLLRNLELLILGSVYGRYTLAQTTTSSNPRLRMGRTSTPRYCRITFVSN